MKQFNSIVKKQSRRHRSNVTWRFIDICQQSYLLSVIHVE